MTAATKRAEGVTIAEAAQELGIPEHRLRNRIQRKTLKTTKLGWMVLIPHSEMERLRKAAQ